MALFTADGWLFFMRWFHFLAGITWSGMLYYFNFVQTPFFATAEPPVRMGMIVGSLVGRALWWFRWGAMFTLITELITIGHRVGQFGGVHEFFATSYGWGIFTGGAIGTLMWANVWFVIWPAQKVVIASATQVAKGGQAIPEAAARAARSGVASRTNVLLSIPMLFFMGAAPHLGVGVSPDKDLTTYFVAVLVVLGVIELNALKGKTGPLLTSVKAVIHSGLGLTVVMVLLVKFLT